MKNLFTPFTLIMIPFLLLSSCGEKGKEESSDEKKAAVKVDAELEKHINALADCKEQNSNCEAYKTTSEYIQKECEDEKKRDAIVKDLFVMIEQGPAAKSQAAAHAVNFWTYGNFRDNPDYGKIVLAALLKEKYADDNYTGSQLGQLLSQWFGTNDEGLYNDILKAVKSKSTERRGRTELIRLIPTAVIGKADMFSALTDIINNPEEEKEVRLSALNIVYRVEGEEQKNAVKSLFESYMVNPEVQLAGTAMMNLGYMESFSSYNQIETILIQNKDVQDWYYYGSYALNYLIKTEGSTVDKNKALTTIDNLISNKTISAYSRSYYVTPLMSLNTPGAKTLLAKLKASGEKEIVAEIERLSK